MAKTSASNVSDTTTTATSPLDNVRKCCGIMFTALKSLCGLLPKIEPDRKGSAEKFDALYAAVSACQRRRVDWEKTHAAFVVLQNQLGDQTDVMVRYLLKTPITLSQIGEKANLLWEYKTAVQSDPMAASYTLGAEGEQFTGRTALSVADDIGNPRRFMELIRGCR